MANTLMEMLHSLIGSNTVIIKLVLSSEDDEVLFETSKPVMGPKIFELIPEEYREKTVRYTQFGWVDGDPMLFFTICEDKKSEPLTLKSVLSLFGDQETRICIIRYGIGRVYCGSIRGFVSSVSDVYNSRVLDYAVDKVYNEIDIDDNGGRKNTFFIRIGGSE